MRILVTGPRQWTDTSLLASALTDTYYVAKYELGWSGRPTLVYGKAKGLDNMAAEEAVNRGWLLEGHAANWYPDGETLDIQAGHKRNQEMVDTKPDIAAVFCMKCISKRCRQHDHFTHGTMDCYRRILEANIPFRKYYS